MRKVALVFVLAVIVPALVLASLALRSLRDQQFVLERQQALLYQGTADALAKEVDAYIAERQREFGLQVETLLASSTPADLAASFDNQLRHTWSMAEVGFAVSLPGSCVLAPSVYSRPEAKDFRLQNDRFLCNQEVVEVYWQNSLVPNALQKPTNSDSNAQVAQQIVIANNQEPKLDLAKDQNIKGKRAVTPQQQAYVAPQQLQQTEPSDNSKVASAPAEFRQLVGDSNEGRIARFLQDRLSLLLWYRSPRDPQLVFGAQLDLDSLKQALRALVKLDPTLQHEICAALIDDRAQPVAISNPGFHSNWKRPFVATEIGEALPHWETAIYLLDPGRLQRSAQTARFTLGLLVAVLVAAIGIGSWLIVTDLRRQLAVARQKTDFVSNVSHELKTPLTSIRMFSELLAEGRVTEPGRQRQFLQIITAETARLGRLINNVLDFARMDRGEKKYTIASCNLTEVVREVVETYRPHLENNGFQVKLDVPSQDVMVKADCDALSQVIVNLLSNAEKYSGDKKEVSVHLENGECARVHVLDRGLGVPHGCEQRIFQQFYRAHDSLGSGIQGSGLGLTLARQIARAHGGDVTYESRDGGGSCFTLTIPCQNNRSA